MPPRAPPQEVERAFSQEPGFRDAGRPGRVGGEPPRASDTGAWPRPTDPGPGTRAAQRQYDALGHNAGVTYARDAGTPRYSYGDAVAGRPTRSPGATVNTMTVEEAENRWCNPGPLYAPHEPDDFDNTAGDEPCSENGC